MLLYNILSKIQKNLAPDIIILECLNMQTNNSRYKFNCKLNIIVKIVTL